MHVISKCWKKNVFQVDNGLELIFLGANFELNPILMIQRIQSLFLLIAISCSISVFFFDFAECVTQDGIVTLTLMKSTSQTAQSSIVSHIELLIINILILSTAIISLISYRNRVLQMRICMIGGLASIIMVVLIFFHADNLQNTTKAHYLIGTYMIAIQTISFTLARRFIRKDELLVRSADRIR